MVEVLPLQGSTDEGSSSNGGRAQLGQGSPLSHQQSEGGPPVVSPASPGEHSLALWSRRPCPRPGVCLRAMLPFESALSGHTYSSDTRDPVSCFPGPVLSSLPAGSCCCSPFLSSGLSSPGLSASGAPLAFAMRACGGARCCAAAKSSPGRFLNRPPCEHRTRSRIWGFLTSLVFIALQEEHVGPLPEAVGQSSPAQKPHQQQQ